MTTRQKLEIIQKMLGLTQTKLAEKFGVSFAAFNSWWTGKSEPRAKFQACNDPVGTWTRAYQNGEIKY